MVLYVALSSLHFETSYFDLQGSVGAGGRALGEFAPGRELLATAPGFRPGSPGGAGIMATPGASHPARWRLAAFSGNSRTGVEFEPERRALGERPPHAQRNPGCRVVPPDSGHWPASEGPLASMIVSTGRAELARPTTFRAYNGRCGIIRCCRRGEPRPTGGYRRPGGVTPPYAIPWCRGPARRSRGRVFRGVAALGDVVSRGGGWMPLIARPSISQGAEYPYAKPAPLAHERGCRVAPRISACGLHPGYEDVVWM